MVFSTDDPVEPEQQQRQGLVLSTDDPIPAAATTQNPREGKSAQASIGERHKM